MDARYKIQQVTNLTESMMLDCYYIAAGSRPNNADDIYYTLQNNVNNRGHILFIAMEDMTLRGFISGHFISKCTGTTETEIDWLFVDSKHNRRGIGGALLRAYVEYCSNHGVDQAVVKPARTVAAKQFYTKHDFTPRSAVYMVRNMIKGR